MAYINSLSKLNSINYEVKVSSSTDKENGKDKKVEEKEVVQVEDNSSDKKLENIIKRLKSIALQLGLTVTDTENIESIIQKIQNRIDELQEDYKNNSNYNIIKSEFEAVKLEYRNITAGQISFINEMDIMAKSNRAVLGI